MLQRLIIRPTIRSGASATSAVTNKTTRKISTSYDLLMTLQHPCIQVPSSHHQHLATSTSASAAVVGNSNSSSGLFRRTRCNLRGQRSVSPLELFMRVQAGGATSTSAASMRTFMFQHFGEELENYGMTVPRINKMDNRSVQELLKRLFFEKYMSVEFAVFTFDLEFTGLPKFTKTGPTEDIIEIGLYCPETDATFSKLVKPLNGKTIQDEVVTLTGITKEQLEDAQPFPEVWEEVKAFIRHNVAEVKTMLNYNNNRNSDLSDEDGDDRYLLGDGGGGNNDAATSASEFGLQNILLLSHGGKLADVSMLKWACKAIDDPIDIGGETSATPFVFGDTNHHIRDLHRRRPITKDKLPPSWKLEDLANWLDLPEVDGAVHRAGSDAKLTWDVLYHTMDRYGDPDLLPRQQLVGRFFDEQGKQSVARMDQYHHGYDNVSSHRGVTDQDAAQAILNAGLDEHNL